MRVDRIFGEFIARLATLGIVETDDDATRTQKSTLTLAAAFITALATVANRIQVSETTYGHLCDRYALEDRGEIDVEGKGRQRAYLLVGRRRPGQAGSDPL